MTYSIIEVLGNGFGGPKHSCKYVKANFRDGFAFTTIEGRENCAQCIEDKERRRIEKENWVNKPCEECGEGSLGFEEDCQECCDHEFDMSEGGYCINGCEKHYTGN